MGGTVDDGTQYSPLAGYIFTFNLIVGAGALALPLAFYNAGLIFGTVFLAALCFLGYITITFMIESMSVANAMHREREVHGSLRVPLESQSLLANDSPVDYVDASVNAINSGDDVSFEINKRVEMSELAQLFLGPIGHKIFFAVYLYGDLAIYCTAVPQSLVTVTQGWSIGSFHFTAYEVFWVYLTAFVLLLGPMCFFDFQKTRFLQYATMALRNISLLGMIILATVYDFQGHGSMPTNWFSVSGFPSVFGAAIYSFMCHHSLPSIVTPIKNKKRVLLILFMDNLTVFITYIGLCWTAVWAFGAATNETCTLNPGPPCKLQSLYTQNFASYNFKPVAVFLVLFPIFTLSSNFPMITITLRNNLMQLITFRKDRMHPTLRRVLFTLLALVPPVIVAYLRVQLDDLVSFTGGFAGLGIMFLFPTLFVFFARRKALQRWNRHVLSSNPYQSPFSHLFWVVLILLWCVFALGGQIYRIVISA